MRTRTASRSGTSAHLPAFGVCGVRGRPRPQLALHEGRDADANGKPFGDVRAPPGFGVCGCADVPERN